MASAKRKQDEKHLKILRELVSQTSNKECFDCRQRGPTYVNMTIGSFVCTSCSGMLRGLTPPHRVKSISMATFTQEEIDLIKERGNEYCKKIWLALIDSSLPQNLDAKDEQKMKDLMSAKYEHKRWYLDPSLANQNVNQKNQTASAPSVTGRSSQASIPRVPQAGTLATLAPINRNNKNSSETIEAAFTPDFGANFTKIGDPFQSATTSPRFTQTILPQPSFANFDNNPAFNSSNHADLSTSTTTTTNSSSSSSSSLFNQSFGSYNTSNCYNGTNAPQSEDRYAALKDLDSLMKQTHLKEDTTATATTTTTTTTNTNKTIPAATVTPLSPWTSNNGNLNASNSIWASNNQTPHVIANPFATGDIWLPSPNLINNNNIIAQSSESGGGQMCNNSINPFRTGQLSSNNGGGGVESQWVVGIGSPGAADVIPSSQLSNPLSGKVWQPTVSPYHANPFMVGTGVANMARNSNNPFL